MIIITIIVNRCPIMIFTHTHIYIFIDRYDHYNLAMATLWIFPKESHAKPRKLSNFDAKVLVLPGLVDPEGHGAITVGLDMFALGMQGTAVAIVTHAQQQHVLGVGSTMSVPPFPSE